MPSKPQLYSFSSPWSTKAKWALAHCGVKYTRVEYVSGFSEPWLRIKLGNFCGKVTVPVLFVPRGPALTDSFDIAAWANDHREASSPTLFPTGIEEAREWNNRSNQILSLARVRGLTKMIKSNEALATRMPKVLRALGPIGYAMTRHRALKVISKYSNEDGAQSDANAWKALEALRDALRARSGEGSTLKGAYICGQFSYSDVVMAVALDLVSPEENSPLRRNPVVARCFAWEEAAAEFADLLEWRDGVYEQHAYWKHR